MKTSSRLRVVHLIGQLGLGGTERQLLVLLKHLDRDRFESHLVVFNASRHGELHQEFEALGIPVTQIPETCRNIFSRCHYLYLFLRRLRPQVIHSWTAHDNPYAGVVGRLAGVPARLGSLRTTVHSTLMNNLPKIVRWLVLHGASRLIVNSETGALELLGEGLPHDRIRLLRNCVPARPVEESPADLSALGLTPEHRLVGLVGNLRAVKNHLFLVDAMARVLPEQPEVRILLVGQSLPNEPDYPKQIEQRLEHYGLSDRFILTGFRPDVPALLARMEICCLTSKSEGMPNVILEAMAAGRPVVATRVGGVPELVRDGESGFLIEPGDSQGFADAVSRLLEDPSLGRRMGRHARELVDRHHSCEAGASRLADLYSEALGQGPEPRDDP